MSEICIQHHDIHKEIVPRDYCPQCLKQQLASVQAQLASVQAELEACKENYRNEVYECSLLQAELEEAKEDAKTWEDRFRKRGYVMEEHAQVLNERDELREANKDLNNALMKEAVRVDTLEDENQALREELELYKDVEGEHSKMIIALREENERYRKALEDIADGNGEACVDCVYNTNAAKTALEGK